MTSQHAISDAPREVPAGKQHAGHSYRLEDGYYAAHNRQPGSSAAGAALVLNRGQIAVFPGRPPATMTEEVGPVYAAPDGSLVVPTGLLFVRFAEGTSAADRRDELERAGYELVQIPGYAPHAAWVRARTGGIPASLRNVAGLEAIPGVENVEPQMLREKAKR
jgi:hypothetical protein